MLWRMGDGTEEASKQEKAWRWPLTGVDHHLLGARMDAEIATRLMEAIASQGRVESQGEGTTATLKAMRLPPGEEDALLRHLIAAAPALALQVMIADASDRVRGRRARKRGERWRRRENKS
jgi:hypothetical protein